MNKRWNVIAKCIVLVVLSALSGCATLPENINRVESHAYTDTQNTRLGRIVKDNAGNHTGKSGFRLLGRGIDAFLARAVLAQLADRSIDAQYYLLHGDLTGKLFIDQLIKAADRGVRVRLLVDDMDLEGRDMGAVLLNSHPNIEVRIFNPFSRNTTRITQFVTRLGSVTRRMHNKSFTVDNQATVLGGRNIGDEYFEADPELAFADLDVLAIGPVAQDVSKSFDQYWNHPLAYPATTLITEKLTPEQIEEAQRLHNEFVAQQSDSPYLEALRSSALADQLRRKDVDFRWGEAEIVSDHPEKLAVDRDARKYHLVTDLVPYFEKIHQEVIIFSPYFVPGKEGVAFLKSLRDRGIRVRVLTNSLASTDVSVVHSGYARYRKELLRAGVELFEMNKNISKKLRKQSKQKSSTGSSKASLHTKSFVFDRERVFIGSLNLDPRSFVENTEIGVVLSVPEIAKEMAAWFDDNIEQLAFRLALEPDEDGKERIMWYGKTADGPIVFDNEPYTGFWKRLWVNIMRILPVESQL